MAPLNSLLSTLLLALTLLSAIATAQSATTSAPPTSSPTIVQSVSGTKYKYQGCYNETTGVSGAGGARALNDGVNEVLEGQMTVPMCLAFCGNQNKTEYKYAGVEFSRECWCAQHISGASTKMDDSQCDLACDGNQTEICGGALKLSVYMISDATPIRIAYMTALIALAGTILYNLL